MTTAPAVAALRDRLDHLAECSCEDDPGASCWYHLNTRQQIEYVAETAVEWLRDAVAAEPLRREIEAEVRERIAAVILAEVERCAPGASGEAAAAWLDGLEVAARIARG